MKYEIRHQNPINVQDLQRHLPDMGELNDLDHSVEHLNSLQSLEFVEGT